MSARDPNFVPVSLEPDSVTEAYKKDIDRTLIRENLKLTPAQRLDKLQAFMEAVHELHGAATRAPSGASRISKRSPSSK